MINKLYEDKNWLNNQYNVLEKSIAKIKELCNGGDIYYWLKKHKIPVRSYSETLSGEKNPMRDIDHSGEKNPFYGKHHTEKHKRKMSEVLSGEKSPMYGRTGANHPNYKGNDVCIQTFHDRVKQIKLIPEVCDICYQKVDKNGTIKLELSNIKNHQHTDNPEDYQWVHRSCHKRYDYKKKKR